MAFRRHCLLITRASLPGAAIAALSLSLCLASEGCGSSPASVQQASVSIPITPDLAGQENNAPPPDQTGGFDGHRAYEHVAKLVSFGPHPPGSEGIHRAQEYIHTQLQGFGCKVEDQDFHANTPVGSVAMKNIVVKIPGATANIILLGTHYDTDTVDQNGQKMTNFVGADDGGSSTGVMLELARHLCKRQGSLSIWIAFFDGEEALQQWSATDSLYGSREMAARMAMSGDLKRLKAFLLADLVGGRNLHMKREANSTPWLRDVVWNTAARLGHTDIFVPQETGAIEDDHLPFMHRGVPCVDVVDLENNQSYWHTPQDTLDKISARSLAIVGHVFLESIPAVEKHAGR